MDWSPATLWWVAAGVLIAAELATGTFYLLMLALGVVVAALAAHAGLGLNAQMILGAVVAIGAVTFWHLKRQRRPLAPPQANRDLNLDIGERVQVPGWTPEGTAEVSYRGAAWRARWAGSGAPAPGEHVIAAIEGTQLLLRR